VGDILKMPFKLIPMITNMTETGANAVGGVPRWMIAIPLAAIGIIISFAVLSVVFNRKDV
jgi:hypothetical protein